MADFGRGIKAGLVTGLIYIAIGGVLGTICQNDLLSLPHFIYGTGLPPITWRSFADFSFVISWLFQYVYRGIVFGAVFAALYSFLPGTASVKKGVVLSAFLWILGAVGLIYMTPGWPAGAGQTSTVAGLLPVSLSSIGLTLVSIISALLFGALVGAIWNRLKGKEVMEVRNGGSALLVSVILGGLAWVLGGVAFLIGVVIRGAPAIGIGSLWPNLLFLSVIFLGLPGWVLVFLAWRRTRRGESGFKLAVAGGTVMALTGVMLLDGVLAIIGGVLSRRQAGTEPSTAEIEQ
jgi:hypothetical protein